MCIYRDNTLTPSNTMTRHRGTISPQRPCTAAAPTVNYVVLVPLSIFLSLSLAPPLSLSFRPPRRGRRRQQQSRGNATTKTNAKTNHDHGQQQNRRQRHGQRMGSARAAHGQRSCGSAALALPVVRGVFAFVSLLLCRCPSHAWPRPYIRKRIN